MDLTRARPSSAVLPAVLAMVAAAVLIAAVLTLDAALLVVVASIALVAAVIVRPRFAVYSMMGIVAFFEVLTPDILMERGILLHVGEGLFGLLVSPIELMLFVGLLSWLAHGAMAQKLDFRAGPVFVPLLLLFALFVFGIGRGLLAGGDARIAFWEARYLALVFVCYILTANTIRTRQHADRLLLIFVVATTAFAFEGALRRITWGLLVPFGTPIDRAYDHTNPVFLGTAIMMVLAQQVFGAPTWQRRAGLAMLPLLAFTSLAMERRAGFIALIVALAGFGLVLLAARRRMFFALFVPMLLISALYLPLFWNNTSLLGQPARAIQSLIQPNWRDSGSNQYRELERINIRATIAQDPVFGVGFGREYLFVVPLPDLSTWELWRYEPHDNVLWIWLKMGILGFAAFLLLFGSGIQRATRIAVGAMDAQLRVAAIFILSAILMSLVISYVDVALVAGGKVTALLGMALGLLGVLERERLSS